MQKSYESFETVIRFVKLHPDWYINPCLSDYDFTDKPNSPILIPKNLDAEGRRILIYKMKNFKSFENVEFFRRTFLTPFLFFFDLNVQQNGLVIIMDFSEANFKKMRKIPVRYIYDTFQLSKFGAIRLKQLNVIGIPSFLKTIFELAKHFTTAKILQRINFINNVNELSNHMNVSVLPKEYGGSSSELTDYSIFELGIASVNKIHKFDVNLNKKDYKDVKSFRKLEID